MLEGILPTHFVIEFAPRWKPRRTRITRQPNMYENLWNYLTSHSTEYTKVLSAGQKSSSWFDSKIMVEGIFPTYFVIEFAPRWKLRRTRTRQPNTYENLWNYSTSHSIEYTKALSAGQKRSSGFYSKIMVEGIFPTHFVIEFATRYAMFLLLTLTSTPSIALPLPRPNDERLLLAAWHIATCGWVGSVLANVSALLGRLQLPRRQLMARPWIFLLVLLSQPWLWTKKQSLTFTSVLVLSWSTSPLQVFVRTAGWNALKRLVVSRPAASRSSAVNLASQGRRYTSANNFFILVFVVSKLLVILTCSLLMPLDEIQLKLSSGLSIATAAVPARMSRDLPLLPCLLLRIWFTNTPAGAIVDLANRLMCSWSHQNYTLLYVERTRPPLWRAVQYGALLSV